MDNLIPDGELEATDECWLHQFFDIPPPPSIKERKHHQLWMTNVQSAFTAYLQDDPHAAVVNALSCLQPKEDRGDFSDITDFIIFGPEHICWAQ